MLAIVSSQQATPRERANGNRARKYDRHNKEILVTQKCDYHEADRQAPGSERYRRQRFPWQTSNLPANNSRKEQKDRHKVPESSEEVPVGPTESLNVEMGRAQLIDQRVHPPTGIDPTESQSVPDREENEQNRGNAK